MMQVISDFVTIPSFFAYWDNFMASSIPQMGRNVIESENSYNTLTLIV